MHLLRFKFQVQLSVFLLPPLILHIFPYHVLARFLPNATDEGEVLAFKLRSKGAVLVEGPKWCGKSNTCMRQAETVIKNAGHRDQRAEHRTRLHTGIRSMEDTSMLQMSGMHKQNIIKQHPEGVYSATKCLSDLFVAILPDKIPVWSEEERKSGN